MIGDGSDENQEVAATWSAQNPSVVAFADGEIEFAEFAKTWNRHDWKAMLELKTDDVEWINVTANHWRGNAAVLKGHSNIHRTIFAQTDMGVEKTLVRSTAFGVPFTRKKFTKNRTCFLHKNEPAIQTIRDS